MRHVLVVLGVILLACYPLLFLFKIGECHWWENGRTLIQDNEEEVGEQVRILVVSDIHVLGWNRHFLDVAWTLFHLRACLDLVVRSISPHVVVILGDHLDIGGRAQDDAAWNAYVSRYHWVTNTVRIRADRGDLQLLEAQIGNHDAAMGHEVTPVMLARFHASFGAVNQRRRLVHSRIEFITVNSLVLQAGVGRKDTMEFIDDIATTAGERDGTTTTTTTTTQDDDVQNPFRVLLTHIPLHRENDLNCGQRRRQERGHITYVAPDVSLVPNVDVLSMESSNLLLSRIQPTLVLSGHLHAECIRKYTDSHIWEVTIPTLSYRMRPDPGYGVITLSITNGKHVAMKSVDICYFPHEGYLFVLLGGGIVLLLIAGVGFPCIMCMWKGGRRSAGIFMKND